MDEEIVTFTFKILNFFVLIGLGAYLFKKYALQKITIGIARKESFIRGLFDRQQELEQQQYELDQIIAKEEYFCLVLKKKIDSWKHQVEKKRKKEQEEQEKYTQIVYTRLKERMKMVVVGQVKEKALQIAVDRARIELKQKFAQEKNSGQFLELTIAWMVEN